MFAKKRRTESPTPEQPQAGQATAGQATADKSQTDQPSEKSDQAAGQPQAVPHGEAKEASEAAGELDVGISQYVNNIPGFSGLIKQRYSDFQVNEISLDGQVVVLKHLAEPEAKEAKEEAPKEEPKEAPVTESEETRKLSELIGADVLAKLFDLANKQDSPKVEIQNTLSKDQRTELHNLIRNGFHSKLDSKTENGRIVVLRSRGGRGGGGTTRGGRPPRGSEFLHFTLYKENRDTMEAVSLISRLLHVPSKSLMFCGTKDRRAATTQRVCWRRGTVQRLEGLHLRGNLAIGDFEFKPTGLKLGDLLGNQFKIVVRNVDISRREQIEAALSSLKTNGFLNYYGLQRFGTFSVPSHVIGKYILCEDFEAAVSALLSPAKQTLQESLPARELYAKTKNAEEALELMPRRCVAECALLGALKESENALNALLRVPHNLKTMYVHAYQSYVWNAMASERIKLNSREVIPGDLVLVNGEGVKRARPVTKEEIASGEVTIFDVVLPTPGFDIEYPENMVAKYEELMKNDGIDCHDMKRKIKEFSMFGSYRNLLAKPLFLTWEFKRYLNAEDTVVYTDKEAIEYKTEYPPEPPSTENCHNALVMKLGLGASQYATMALREAMKQETSRNGAMYYQTDI